MKPYANLGTQQLPGASGFERESRGGLDLKYGLTSNLTLDLTWNTDFAQVETDNVQINLTRFDLFFPEKREFFLERAGLFEFGAGGNTEVFFSRRIGLDADITGGGRLTGQVGPVSVGALSLRTAEPGEGDSRGPPAWNSVVRLQANLRERTTVGAIATSRESGAGRFNRVAGADFLTRFWTSSEFRLWGARVWDPALAGGGDDGWRRAAGQADLRFQNDRYQLRVNRLRVGPAFDPALGFVQRPDQDRWSGWIAFSPRFESSRWARRAEVLAYGYRVNGFDGGEQSRVGELNAGMWLESGDGGGLQVRERAEFLDHPVTISGREIPAGDYRFRSVWGRFGTNDSRPLSGFVTGSTGGFWSGTRDRLGGGLTWKTGPYLTVGAAFARNVISLPVRDGDFTTTLFTLNVQAAVSRKLFAGGLVQWDNLSKELQANIRVDWIHTPGSDLFLVLDTGYITDDTLDPRLDPWTRRTAVAKLTWLKAF